MAEIHLKPSNNPNISFDGRSSASDVQVGHTSVPKYVGARAVVTRSENGVTIWMKDYKGETTETIAEAIQSITTNLDGSLTFTLPDGRTITTGSLKGDKGDTGDTGATGNGIASVSKTGTSGLVDTYTITYTNGGSDTFTVTNGEEGNGIASIVFNDDYTMTIIDTDGNSYTSGSLRGAQGETGATGATGPTGPQGPMGTLPYATCDTLATTSAKVATIVSGTLDTLNTGSAVIVYFSSYNMASSPTLKVGNTDAKQIMRYEAVAPGSTLATSWNAGSPVLFIYDGTYWRMVGFLNTTYDSMPLAEAQAGTASTYRLITASVLKEGVKSHAPVKDVTAGGTSVLDGTTAKLVAFTGTDGEDPGTIGLVPAPATTDEDKYLNADGTWQKVVVPTKTSDLTNDSLYARGHVASFHGTCSTAAGTAEKAVTCADFTSADLVAGAMILVTFSNTNSAAVADLKLNVNSTGAYYIKQNNAGSMSNLGDKGYLKTGVTYPFIFNGTYWITWYDTNTNTIGYTIRTSGMTLPVKTACYRYRICFTSPDGKNYVPANASTSTSATASKTVTTEKIDPLGRIIYYNYTTALSAGANISATYQMQQYNGVTLGYSFNRTGAALTMTSAKPVYVKAAPQTDGSAIIDADNPFVQDLPTTEDGKIYIFLGVATAATTIEFTLEHPVYCYKDGCLRQWTNATGSGGGITYCTCTDSASTVAKTATIVSGNLNTLTAGATVAVKFDYQNTAASPTLQVGSTEAKAIKRYGTTAAGQNVNESWNAGSVVLLVYDGTNWIITDFLNTTYSGGTSSGITTGTDNLNYIWSPKQIHDGISGMLPTSTDTPTADTIAEFDASAHINSEDMSAQDVSDFVDALAPQGYSMLIKHASRNCAWSNSEGSDEFYANTLLPSYTHLYGVLATAVGGGVMAVTRSSADKLRVILYGGAFTGTLPVDFIFFYD